MTDIPTSALPPEAKCPACGYQFDAASPLEGDAVPGPGDLTICIACGALLEFDFALRHRVLPEERAQTLPSDVREKIARSQEFIRRLRGRRT